jgi:hypothetical protein
MFLLQTSTAGISLILFLGTLGMLVLTIGLDPFYHISPAKGYPLPTAPAGYRKKAAENIA